MHASFAMDLINKLECARDGTTIERNEGQEEDPASSDGIHMVGIGSGGRSQHMLVPCGTTGVGMLDDLEDEVVGIGGHPSDRLTLVKSSLSCLLQDHSANGIDTSSRS